MKQIIPAIVILFTGLTFSDDGNYYSDIDRIFFTSQVNGCRRFDFVFSRDGTPQIIRQPRV